MGYASIRIEYPIGNVQGIKDQVASAVDAFVEGGIANITSQYTLTADLPIDVKPKVLFAHEIVWHHFDARF